MWRDELMGMLPKLYRDDPWLLQVLGAAGDTLDRLEKQLAELHENRYFDGMTFALPIWEQILAVLARKNATDDDRRAALRAKWLTCRKADRELLQAIADSWMENTVEVGFEAGYLILRLLSPLVLPYWDSLLSTINVAKPAHLPILPTIPVETTLYIGGTLVPYYQTTNLPPYLPEYAPMQANVNGALYSAVTIKLPPAEVN